MAPRTMSPHRLEIEPDDQGSPDRYEADEDLKPLLEIPDGSGEKPSRGTLGAPTQSSDNEKEFWKNAKIFGLCFCGIMTSYLLLVVAMVFVKARHGAIFANNKAPLWAFSPAAFSNTVSSFSQYAALNYVSFPEQTIFKSSKIIAVMMMGKALQGKTYPWLQYFEAFVITLGVYIFSLASFADDRDSHTELVGIFLLVLYVSFDSFTAQYQDKVYQQYGRENVDPFQMMLGINVTAIIMTSLELIVCGELPVVWEFLLANPSALWYNILTAITSASGQISIFYTISHFGPIVFTIIMTTRQMLSICISAIMFGHTISGKALVGAAIVFGVIFDRIRRKYQSSKAKSHNGTRQQEKSVELSAGKNDAD